MLTQYSAGGRPVENLRQLIQRVVLVLRHAAVGARELLHQQIHAGVRVRKNLCAALDLRQVLRKELVVNYLMKFTTQPESQTTG